MSSLVTVVAYVEERRGEPDWSARLEAFAAVAVDLAAALDGCDPQNKSAIAKELRATMAELVPAVDVEDDVFDSWAASLAEPV